MKWWHVAIGVITGGVLWLLLTVLVWGLFIFGIIKFLGWMGVWDSIAKLTGGG